MKQRDVSYGELIALDEEFEKQAQGVAFPDDEIREQCRLDFCDQYINGNDDPQININF